MTPEVGLWIGWESIVLVPILGQCKELRVARCVRLAFHGLTAPNSQLRKQPIGKTRLQIEVGMSSESD